MIYKKIPNGSIDESLDQPDTKFNPGLARIYVNPGRGEAIQPFPARFIPVDYPPM